MFFSLLNINSLITQYSGLQEIKNMYKFVAILRNSHQDKIFDIFENWREMKLCNDPKRIESWITENIMTGYFWNE